MTAKLKGVDPVLARKVEAILHDMETLGHPMCVTEGKRSYARQLWLYSQGRTRKGPIVTRTMKSNHLKGKAVDCAFLVNGKPSWDESLPWKVYGQHAEARGLVWGGRWEKPDKPHVELP